jgi:glutathione S-transferase
VYPTFTHATSAPANPWTTQNSQSQRILWLLEELGIEYNLVKHQRVDGRAPKEMRAVQQLGRAPTLVTAEGRAIIESSAVIAYLIKTYDADGRFASEDWLKDEQLTSFAGASLGMMTVLEITLEIVVKRTPWPVSYVMRAAQRGFQNAFTAAEFKKNLEYLESELGEGEWFNGKHPSRSDFMLFWPVDLIAARGWIDYAKDYPKLDAWRKRALDREAWKRGLKKGNGYDLTALGQMQTSP